VNGLGAKNVLNQDGSALAAGQLTAGSYVTVTYQTILGAWLVSGGLGSNGPFPVGSVAAPSVTFSGFTDVGLYLAAAHTLGFAANGNQLLQVNGTSNSVQVNPGLASASSAQMIVNGPNAGVIPVLRLASNGINLEFTGDASNNWQVNMASAKNVTATLAQGLKIAAPGAGFNALAITGISNTQALSVVAGSTTGQSFGAVLQGGTNSSDSALLVKDNSGVSFFQLRGDRTIQGYGVTAAGLTDMTPDTGTFTGTLTGCTTSPTATLSWRRIGPLVELFIPSLNAVSNTTACTITGLPTVVQPATSQWLPCAGVENASANVAGAVLVTAASGTITLAVGFTGGQNNFTNANSKGVNGGMTVTYILS
jgi:hypothetical protein